MVFLWFSLIFNQLLGFPMAASRIKSLPSEPPVTRRLTLFGCGQQRRSAINQRKNMGTSMENHRKMMEHDGTYPLLMEVYSWEDHRTKWWMSHCHVWLPEATFSYALKPELFLQGIMDLRYILLACFPWLSEWLTQIYPHQRNKTSTAE